MARARRPLMVGVLGALLLASHPAQAQRRTLRLEMRCEGEAAAALLQALRLQLEPAGLQLVGAEARGARRIELVPDRCAAPSRYTVRLDGTSTPLDTGTLPPFLRARVLAMWLIQRVEMPALVPAVIARPTRQLDTPRRALGTALTRPEAPPAARASVDRPPPNRARSSRLPTPADPAPPLPEPPAEEVGGLLLRLSAVGVAAWAMEVAGGGGGFDVRGALGVRGQPGLAGEIGLGGTWLILPNNTWTELRADVGAAVVVRAAPWLGLDAGARLRLVHEVLTGGNAAPRLEDDVELRAAVFLRARVYVYEGFAVLFEPEFGFALLDYGALNNALQLVGRLGFSLD